MFRGRTLLIATKHEKEKIIAPILEKELEVKCMISSKIDTDEFGTFSGEIERNDDPITTARNKCNLAMAITNCDMAIASEGSFGTHPSNFLMPADDEFLLFMDRKNDLEIIVRVMSIETNFSAAEIKSEQELKQFAELALFPTHGLILRKYKNEYQEIKRGITDWKTLIDTYLHLGKPDGMAYAETDMRAMYNPSRMNVIKKATQKLANKINTKCPNCNTPGFGVTDNKPGLPCELCHIPTRSTLINIYTCNKCAFTKEEKYPNGIRVEDPGFCDFCNP